MGMGRNGKREGDWGERGRDACYKNPLLFAFHYSRLRLATVLFVTIVFNEVRPSVFTRK